MPIEIPRRIFRRSQEPLAADVSLIASEFLAGFQLIQQIDRPAVSIFGSARIVEGSPSYEQARATGRAFADAGFAVRAITPVSGPTNYSVIEAVAASG